MLKWTIFSVQMAKNLALWALAQGRITTGHRASCHSRFQWADQDIVYYNGQWFASTDIHIAVFKDTNYLKSLLLFGQYPSSPHPSSWGIVTHCNTAPFAQLAVVAVSAVYQTAVYQTDPVFRNRPRHLVATSWLQVRHRNH